VTAQELRDAVSRRPWLWAVVAALLLLLLGYGAGRYATPAKVVEKEVVKTQLQDKIVYKDRIVTQKVLVEVAKRDTHTVTATTKKPDGTVTTTVTRDDHVDEHKKDDTNTTETASKVETKVITQTVEKLKIVQSQASWRVSAGVGVSVPHFLGQGDVGIPGMQGAVVTVGADRRIVGPLWLGVWGTTQGAVGADLAMSW
jgi:hypothetical protein